MVLRKFLFWEGQFFYDGSYCFISGYFKNVDIENMNKKVSLSEEKMMVDIIQDLVIDLLRVFNVLCGVVRF